MGLLRFLSSSWGTLCARRLATSCTLCDVPFSFLYLVRLSCCIACGQVEKQTAHFYSVDITEQEAKKGLVCRVHSTERSKFKVVFC